MAFSFLGIELLQTPAFGVQIDVNTEHLKPPVHPVDADMKQLEAENRWLEVMKMIIIFAEAYYDLSEQGSV